MTAKKQELKNILKCLVHYEKYHKEDPFKTVYHDDSVTAILLSLYRPR